MVHEVVKTFESETLEKFGKFGGDSLKVEIMEENFQLNRAEKIINGPEIQLDLNTTEEQGENQEYEVHVGETAATCETTNEIGEEVIREGSYKVIKPDAVNRSEAEKFLFEHGKNLSSSSNTQESSEDEFIKGDEEESFSEVNQSESVPAGEKEPDLIEPAVQNNDEEKSFSFETENKTSGDNQNDEKSHCFQIENESDMVDSLNLHITMATNNEKNQGEVMNGENSEAEPVTESKTVEEFSPKTVDLTTEVDLSEKKISEACVKSSDVKEFESQIPAVVSVVCETEEPRITELVSFTKESVEGGNIKTVVMSTDVTYEYENLKSEVNTDTVDKTTNSNGLTGGQKLETNLGNSKLKLEPTMDLAVEQIQSAEDTIDTTIGNEDGKLSENKTSEVYEESEDVKEFEPQIPVVVNVVRETEEPGKTNLVSVTSEAVEEGNKTVITSTVVTYEYFKSEVLVNTFVIDQTNDANGSVDQKPETDLGNSELKLEPTMDFTVEMLQSAENTLETKIGNENELLSSEFTNAAETLTAQELENIPPMHEATDISSSSVGESEIQRNNKVIPEPEESNELNSVDVLTENGSKIENIDAVTEIDNEITPQPEETNELNSVHVFTEDGSKIENIDAVTEIDHKVTPEPEESIEINLVNVLTEDGSKIENNNAVTKIDNEVTPEPRETNELNSVSVLTDAPASVITEKMISDDIQANENQEKDLCEANNYQIQHEIMETESSDAEVNRNTEIEISSTEEATSTVEKEQKNLTVEVQEVSEILLKGEIFMQPVSEEEHDVQQVIMKIEDKQKTVEAETVLTEEMRFSEAEVAMDVEMNINGETDNENQQEIILTEPTDSEVIINESINKSNAEIEIMESDGSGEANESENEKENEHEIKEVKPENVKIVTTDVVDNADDRNNSDDQIQHEIIQENSNDAGNEELEEAKSTNLCAEHVIASVDEIQHEKIETRSSNSEIHIDLLKSEVNIEIENITPEESSGQIAIQLQTVEAETNPDESNSREGTCESMQQDETEAEYQISERGQKEFETAFEESRMCDETKIAVVKETANDNPTLTNKKNDLQDKSELEGRAMNLDTDEQKTEIVNKNNLEISAVAVEAIDTTEMEQNVTIEGLGGKMNYDTEIKTEVSEDKVGSSTEENKAEETVNFEVNIANGIDQAELKTTAENTLEQNGTEEPTEKESTETVNQILNEKETNNDATHAVNAVETVTVTGQPDVKDKKSIDVNVAAIDKTSQEIESVGDIKIETIQIETNDLKDEVEPVTEDELEQPTEKINVESKDSIIEKVVSENKDDVPVNTAAIGTLDNPQEIVVTETTQETVVNSTDGDARESTIVTTITTVTVVSETTGETEIKEENTDSIVPDSVEDNTSTETLPENPDSSASDITTDITSVDVIIEKENKGDTDEVEVIEIANLEPNKDDTEAATDEVIDQNEGVTDDAIIEDQDKNIEHIETTNEEQNKPLEFDNKEVTEVITTETIAEGEPGTVITTTTEETVIKTPDGDSCVETTTVVTTVTVISETEVNTDVKDDNTELVVVNGAVDGASEEIAGDNTEITTIVSAVTEASSEETENTGKEEDEIKSTSVTAEESVPVEVKSEIDNTEEKGEETDPAPSISTEITPILDVPSETTDNISGDSADTTSEEVNKGGDIETVQDTAEAEKTDNTQEEVGNIETETDKVIEEKESIVESGEVDNTVTEVTKEVITIVTTTSVEPSAGAGLECGNTEDTTISVSIDTKEATEPETMESTVEVEKVESKDTTAEHIEAAPGERVEITLSAGIKQTEPEQISNTQVEKESEEKHQDAPDEQNSEVVEVTETTEVVESSGETTKITVSETVVSRTEVKIKIVSGSNEKPDEDKSKDDSVPKSSEEPPTDTKPTTEPEPSEEPKSEIKKQPESETPAEESTDGSSKVEEQEEISKETTKQPEVNPEPTVEVKPKEGISVMIVNDKKAEENAEDANKEVPTETKTEELKKVDENKNTDDGKPEAAPVADSPNEEPTTKEKDKVKAKCCTII